MKLNSFELDGQALSVLRRMHKLEQKELGKALNVSQATVSYWESDSVRISPERQQQIFEFFLSLPQPVELLKGLEYVLYGMKGGEDLDEEETA